MNCPEVGSKGRTITQLAPSGKVVVDGETFLAETSMFGANISIPAIPSNRIVVVSGWRADDEYGVVLLVMDPDAPAGEAAETTPAHDDEAASPPTPDERLSLLETQIDEMAKSTNELRARLPSPRHSEPHGGIGTFLLTLGQIMSLIVCIVAPIRTMFSLSAAAAVRTRIRDAPDMTLWIVFEAAVLFLYSAAMFVVFARVKQLPPNE